MKMEFKFNDGGRAEAGYKGRTGDCTIRAIAIATGYTARRWYLMEKNKNNGGQTND